MTTRSELSPSFPMIRTVLNAAVTFAAGAFVTSTFMFYADPWFAADLSGNAPAILGGAVTSIMAIIRA